MGRDAIDLLLLGYHHPRHQVEDMATKHHFGTPIHKIPPEIVAAIFLLCIPRSPSANTPNPAHAPLLLCRVCKAWRTIAREFPFLWRQLTLRSNYAEGPRGEAELVDIWCRNAAPFPIDLKLDLASDSPQTIWNMIGGENTLSSILAPSAHRFISLDLTIPSFVKFPLDVEFSLLERLSLIIQDDYPSEELLPIATFAASPKLHSLTLSVPADILSTKLLLPFSQITCLILDETKGIPPNTLHSILAASSSLEHLNATIRIPDTAHTPPLLTHTITLDRLQTLFITFQEKPNQTTTLLHLTFRPLNMPSLGSLSLTSYGLPGTIPLPWQEGSSPSLEHSLRNITSLTLNHYEFTWGMMHFLRCTPAVETLKVVLDDLGGIGLWEALVRPGLNLLPQLTRMEVVLGRASCATWSIEVLCAMVLSRWMNLQTTGLGSNASSSYSASNTAHPFSSPLSTVRIRLQPDPSTDSSASWIYSAVALIHARLGRCSVQGMGLEVTF
ncbi:hypothetical protein K443DRAFT_675219 [Laccaria amethystina LaAM-08-1]|uniref:F-box domain-containing protein n=1 Tax=Laccaria amethystina LaAM-08-1 TaxID=1095629 RepID=A0A0C9Y527_9AGAR|nr:hypothetical protein K443DRAFT_675219 [Laccaria amethystina LaAM-08-1]